jgi:5-methyltetrahydropteroyltriglutamate--homocysteine methyltransferase
MKRSTNHILTTHTGSLPRPSDLVDMVLRKEAKQQVDEDVLAMRVCSAVAEVVQRQAEVGVTVLNDGEQGKPGYSTYMKDRLTGFEGESTAAAVSGEAKDFPEYTARRTGRVVPRRPACTGPIAWKDRDAVRRDIENLQTAVKEVETEEVFMTWPPLITPCGTFRLIGRACTCAGQLRRPAPPGYPAHGNHRRSAKGQSRRSLL